MKRYNPSEIEPKWQQIWADDQRYKAPDISDKPKYYVTGMFPYPSGAGMHTGHFFEHSIVDTVARFRRALGNNVMYPMGFDNFGLPAENYAIKTGVTPQQATRDNIANFRNQLTRVGASIDWSREVRTSDPEYYRWTQWIFTQLFERGLAYQKEANQWWCPQDKTVLANEQVEGGKCWRCGSVVEKKAMKQWFFKITDYADALLDEIPDLNWPDKIKTAQTNWIGRSQGAEVDFVVAESETESEPILTVFTTRPDTIFGATFMVIAPEHPIVKTLVTDETRDAVTKYVNEAIKKSEIERQSEGKEKTGVFTGGYAINPANGEKIPIWVADYVLWGYGTGAIMAVPAHDERDFAFAEKYELPIQQVVARYEIFSGDQEPHEDVETVQRLTVDAIIHDDSGNYLVQTEGTQSHFVGGGVDENEAPEVALRREVTEETGYTDIVSIRRIAPISAGKAYRHTKNINQEGVGYYFEVVLGSKAQVASEVDAGKHKIKWVPKDMVRDQIDWSWQRDAWDSYVGGASPDLYIGEGVLVNSSSFNGVFSSEAREEVTAWLEQQGVGRSKTTYKMRDWLISRQRYWGAPIPVVHCAEHGAVAVPDDQLPVLLPDVEDFVPKGDGKSPLARQEEWVNTTCPTCGGPAKRETDVMDGYACSSWYLLRYADPQNDKQAWDPKLADYWTPLDMYVGGDHAVAHLLYVRFWSHVFHDMKLVPTREPVKQLVYHGLVQAEDGRKMSKSLGNVVDPLEVIDAGYGADTLRVFELFLGPINENSNWSSKGIAGVYRFMNRVWTLTQEFLETTDVSRSSDSRMASSPESNRASAPVDSGAADVARVTQDETLLPAELVALQHRTIKKVSDDIHRLSFNTAIAALMEYVNELYKLKTDGFSDAWREPIETLVRLLQPMAPHMTAELWQQLGHDDQLDFVAWPTWDDALTVAETMTIVVQVNGKVRAKLEVAADANEDDIKKLALADEHVQSFVSGEPKKVIYIKGRLVSVVV